MKPWIKNSLFIFLFCLSSSSLLAQKIEVNPAIQWRFVRSQSMNLVDGLWYDFEFPAEKGFDYALVINHSLDSAKLLLSIADLQGAHIFKKELLEIKPEIYCYFDVAHTSTYKMLINLSDGKNEIKKNQVNMSLIRRIKIQ